MLSDRTSAKFGFFLALSLCFAEGGCNADADSYSSAEFPEIANDVAGLPNGLHSHRERLVRGTDSFGAEASAPKAEPGCTLSDEPLRISSRLVRDNWTGIDVAELVIRNDYDLDADITISVTALSERQDNDNYRVGVGSISAHSEAVVQVDVASLGISKEALEIAGNVLFITHARFADGEEERGPGPKLNFHPEGNHLRLYPDVVRRERPDRGHLSAQAREHARILQQQYGVPGDFMFAPSFVGASESGAKEEDHLGEREETNSPTQERTEGAFKICFRQTTNYIDAKVGEDYWNDDAPTAYLAIGQNYSVEGPGGQWNGFLSGGCFSPSNYAPGIYLATFRSRGNVNGWDIEGQDLQRNLREDWYYFWVTSENTINVTLAYNDVQNGYMAVARALSVHGGLAANKGDVDLRVGNCGDDTHYDAFSDILFVCKGSKEHHLKKFTMAHELGHMMQEKNSNLFEHDDSYFPNNGTNDCDPLGNGTSHGTTSIEYQGVAANEGYATFYAADAWNRHAQGDDCWVSIGKYGKHPCREGDSNKHPKRLMINRCNEGPGLGNETDWARAFWKLHTYPYPGKVVSHDTMLQWMADGEDEAAGSTNRSYEALSDAAGDWGVSVRWSNVAEENGIDFPVGILF